MLLAFRIDVKLLVTQSKQRSLCELSSLRSQPTLSHRLQRRYDRWLRTQSLTCRRINSQLSQALCVMLLAPDLELMPKETPLFFSPFPMFVPSLSW